LEKSQLAVGVVISTVLINPDIIYTPSNISNAESSCIFTNVDFIALLLVAEEFFKHSNYSITAPNCSRKQAILSINPVFLKLLP